LKKAIVALAVLLLTMPAGTTESKKTHVYIGAGLGIPTGNAGDGWNLGIHGQAGFGIAAGPHIEIIPTIGYHIFSLDKHGAWVIGGGLSVLMVGGDCKIFFVDAGKKIVPFIVGGLGAGIAKIDDLNTSGFGSLAGDNETKVYYNIGAGLDIKTSTSVAVSFIQVRFVSVMTSGSATTFIPITVGLRF
jgi:opacity protein-like surface antigen